MQLAARTAAPDHIKLSYSGDNNFRLLRSGPLWEAEEEEKEEL